MKQTVEEAAINELFFSYACTPRTDVQHPSFDGLVYDKNAMLNMFKAGAEWQAKQSPWISVKERLPEYNKKVIVLHGDECFISLMYNFGFDCWAVGDDQNNDLLVSENDFWLPISSFDEILEPNKDVLQRMK